MTIREDTTQKRVIGPVADSYEHDNEPLCSIKGRVFLEQLCGC
jgi:hypothetical protein